MITLEEARKRAEAYEIQKADAEKARENKKQGIANWLEFIAEGIARAITSTDISDDEDYDVDDPVQWEALHEAIKTLLENTSEGAKDENGHYDPKHVGSGIYNDETVIKAATKIITTMADFQRRWKKQNKAYEVQQAAAEILKPKLEAAVAALEEESTWTKEQEEAARAWVVAARRTKYARDEFNEKAREYNNALDEINQTINDEAEESDDPEDYRFYAPEKSYIEEAAFAADDAEVARQNWEDAQEQWDEAETRADEAFKDYEGSWKEEAEERAEKENW